MVRRVVQGKRYVIQDRERERERELLKEQVKEGVKREEEKNRMVWWVKWPPPQQSPDLGNGSPVPGASIYLT